MNTNKKSNKTPRARTVAKKTAVAVDRAKNAHTSTAPTVVYATHEQTPVVYTNTRGLTPQVAAREIAERDKKIAALKAQLIAASEELEDAKAKQNQIFTSLRAKNAELEDDLRILGRDYDKLEDALVDAKFSRDVWAIGAIVISGVSIALAALHFFANHY